MKKLIKVKVFSDNCNYDLPEDPKKFMEYWENLLNMVPAKFMDTASISVEAEAYYKDSVSLNVHIEYTRPETDKEYALRLKDEEERKHAQRIHELTILKSLREKYNE